MAVSFSFRLQKASFKLIHFDSFLRMAFIKSENNHINFQFPVRANKLQFRRVYVTLRDICNYKYKIIKWNP